MKGREGKFYIQRQYDYAWDRWQWFVTCWLGDEWRIFEIDANCPLPYVFDYALIKAKEFAGSTREELESQEFQRTRQRCPNI